jgi:hypothetical protein
MRSSKHAHADHAAYAAFWHCRSAQLDVVFISRGTSGVAACFGVQRHGPCRAIGGFNTTGTSTKKHSKRAEE